MGDMGDLFNDLKDIRRTRAQQRVTEFESKRQALENAIREVVTAERSQVYFSLDASGTFNIKIHSHTGPLRRRDSTIQFYPTKGTWQVKGRMWHGGVDAFQTWITRTLRKVL